ncbi:MAG: right-handed parallel beta-helix repeat-containing protein, partial [Planctomycetales bacterium]
EWLLDSNKNTLYFRPPEGLDLAKAKIETAQLKHLFEFQGSLSNPVKFVTLRGLTMRHARRTFMEIKEPLLRSDWCIYRGGAVLMDGVEDCAISDCEIDGVGGNAIFVSNYARRVQVTGCKIAEVGGNGVCFVGDPDAVRSPRFEYGQTFHFEKIDRTPGPKTENYPRDCRVHDCLITRIGRVHKQSAAVQISMSQGLTVSHCSIYDVPRAGINISEGTWNGHLIEFCDVFDTVKETGDHGSFNSWGRDRFWHLGGCDLKEHPELPLLDAQTKTVLRNNRWRCDHGWDIDLDDGSTNYHIYNNLCLNGGIKNREGFHRLVENNVMVNNGFHPHVWYEQSGDVFRRNIVFRNYRPARMSNMPWGKQMDFNL